ncbi:MAG: adaptor protein MecA [Lachnospiraceae bacterium]|nr:adaptor protein MecA [Lachnospiraceae bacterium]
MRLEKVSENQIRCILTKEDLELRQLKISEIAYGSDKAKMLFKDVMQQASYELGFEADNIPLMIEAIPMNTGCVVFIITKVENPEELDTRFSRFAPSVLRETSDADEDSDEDNSIDFDLEGNTTVNIGQPANIPSTPSATARIEIVGGDALKEFLENMNLSDENGVIDLFRKISASAMKAQQASAGKTPEAKNTFFPKRVFMFDDLDTVGKVSKVLSVFYEGLSSLYKSPDDGKFYMLLEQGDYDKKEFAKVSNLMLEYGSYVKTNDAVIAHMKEHYKCLIAHDAVAGMAQF